jgi:hypothetical protein
LLGFARFSGLACFLSFFDFVGFCLGKLDPRNQSAKTSMLKGASGPNHERHI